MNVFARNVTDSSRADVLVQPSGAIFHVRRSRFFRAIGGTVNFSFRLNAVAKNTTITMRTGGREFVDCALETIEDMFPPVLLDNKSLVVTVRAGFARTLATEWFVEFRTIGCVWPARKPRFQSMRSAFDLCRPLMFLSPEYGGDVVSGGGHPADSPVPVEEAIDDAFGQDAGGRGKTPGVGVPGSRTNPVGQGRDEIARRAHELWQQAGEPEGRSEEFWLRAENEFQYSAG
jgi:DUF2934 family protein